MRHDQRSFKKRAISPQEVITQKLQTFSVREGLKSPFPEAEIFSDLNKISEDLERRKGRKQRLNKEELEERRTKDARQRIIYAAYRILPKYGIGKYAAESTPEAAGNPEASKTEQRTQVTEQTPPGQASPSATPSQQPAQTTPSATPSQQPTQTPPPQQSTQTTPPTTPPQQPAQTTPQQQPAQTTPSQQPTQTTPPQQPAQTTTPATQAAAKQTPSAQASGTRIIPHDKSTWKYWRRKSNQELLTLYRLPLRNELFGTVLNESWAGESTFNRYMDYVSLLELYGSLLGFDKIDPELKPIIEDVYKAVHEGNDWSAVNLLIDAGVRIHKIFAQRDEPYYRFAEAYKSLLDSIATGKFDVSDIDRIRGLVVLFAAKNMFRVDSDGRLYFNRRFTDDDDYASKVFAELYDIRRGITHGMFNPDELRARVIALIPMLEQFKNMLYNFRGKARPSEDIEAFIDKMESLTAPSVETAKAIQYFISMPTSRDKPVFFDAVAEAYLTNMVRNTLRRARQTTPEGAAAQQPTQVGEESTAPVSSPTPASEAPTSAPPESPSETPEQPTTPPEEAPTSAPPTSPAETPEQPTTPPEEAPTSAPPPTTTPSAGEVPEETPPETASIPTEPPTESPTESPPEPPIVPPEAAPAPGSPEAQNVIAQAVSDLQTLREDVSKTMELDYLLRRARTDKRAYAELMQRFPDYATAFDFLYRNDLLKYDPDKLSMLLRDPTTRNQTQNSLRTLLKYQFLRRALQKVRAIGYGDLSTADDAVLGEVLSGEISDLYAKVYGTQPLTDADYFSILQGLRDSGFRVSGVAAPTMTALPATTGVPLPTQSISGGIKAFISSLGPLSLFSLILGLPLGIAGLAQILFKEEPGTGAFALGGLGAILTALGFMNVDKFVGLR